MILWKLQKYDKLLLTLLLQNATVVEFTVHCQTATIVEI